MSKLIGSGVGTSTAGRLPYPESLRWAGRRPCLGGLAILLAVAPAAWADPLPAAAVRPGDLVQAGCVVHLGERDGRGLAPVSADCRWPVAPEHVTGILRDHGRMGEVMSSLSESRALPDGRIVQVHRGGPLAAERQVTVRFEPRLLADGGLRLDFRLAARQRPVREGRVQVAVNEGWWEVRPDGSGGTWLRYAVRYDAGGRLQPWIVRRFQKAGVARSMGELRRAAERVAGLASRPAPAAPGAAEPVSAPPPPGLRANRAGWR